MPRVHRRSTGCLRALLCALALSALGCTQDAPTATHPRLAPAPPRRIEVPAESRLEGGEAFSFSIPSQVNAGYVKTGIHVRRGDYLAIDMRGLLTIHANFSCGPSGTAKCVVDFDGRTVGPNGILEVLPSYSNRYLGISARVFPDSLRKDTVIGGNYDIGLLGPPGPLPPDPVGTLWAGGFLIDRNEVVSGVGMAPATGELEFKRWEYADRAYSLAGSQTATVRSFTPLVQRPAVRTASGAMHFVAQTSGTPFRVRWTFMENDTAGRLPSDIRPVAVTACANEMTCDYTPSKAGRMEVAARLTETGSTHYSSSEVVPAGGQVPKLVLTCTGDLGANRVTRGRGIACTARKEPADAVITPLRWTFVDSTGRRITGPSGDGVFSWGGPMVTGGTISVVGRIATSSAVDSTVASTMVKVASRSWGKLRVRGVDQGHGGETAGKFRQDDSPQVISHMGHAHLPEFPSPIDQVTISDGPNQGFVYLGSFPQQLIAVIHISRAWDAGHPFREMQHPGPVLDANNNPILDAQGNPIQYCRKTQLAGMKVTARRHEQEHTQRMDDFFKAHSPHAQLEATVAHVRELGVETFVSVVQRAFWEPLNQGRQSGDIRYEDVANGGQVPPATFPCRLRF